jgi:hypothetical protein
MGIWNGRVVSQLAQNVIKRLGGNVAWWHDILFFPRREKGIREGRIQCQKSTKHLFQGGF